MSTEVNLKAELRRGFVLYRAFEHGMELADKLEGLEAAIAQKKKELDKADAQFKEKEKEYAAELDKIAVQLEKLRSDEMSEFDLFKKEKDQEKAAIEARVKKLKDDAKKAEGVLENKNKEINELDSKIVLKKNDLEKFNKEIEETKARFKGMF